MKKKCFFLESIFFVSQVQNLNFKHDFKPGSFEPGFQIFTRGQISFNSGTQILHLGAFDALSRLLGRIWDKLCIKFNNLTFWFCNYICIKVRGQHCHNNFKYILKGAAETVCHCIINKQMASDSGFIICPFPDFHWLIKSLATFGLAQKVLLYV